MARSSFHGNVRRTLFTFGFVDDVMFSHDGENWPESKTTRMFCPDRQVAAPGQRLPSPTASC